MIDEAGCRGELGELGVWRSGVAWPSGMQG